MKMLKTLSIWILTLPPTATFAPQPDPAQMALTYSQAAKQNATMLAQYNWTMRAEVTLDVEGETKQVVKLYEVRTDLDGRPQKTELTAPRLPVEPSKRGFGIRAKIQNGKRQEKVAESMQWAGQLQELVQSYATPSAGTMFDFYAKASYTPLQNGLVKVEGRGFLQPDDIVTFLIDGATKAPHSVAFKTRLDQDAVQGNVEFSQVPAGPRYAERTTVKVPAKGLTVKIETYEYRNP
jgi:hypothetical protein